MKRNMKTEPSTPLKLLTDVQKMQINDLADGQLQGEDFASVMSTMNDSDQARSYWHSLHLVGDVLRTQTSASSVEDTNFLAKFRANLAKEPLLQAVNHTNLIRFEPSARASTTEPANEPFFNWKWAAGLSALAASFLFGMNLVGITDIGPTSSGSQQAQTSHPVMVNGQAAVILRNPQLDALIAAHSQVGGSSALQMPSGFLRSATFTPSVLGDK